MHLRAQSRLCENSQINRHAVCAALCAAVSRRIRKTRNRARSEQLKYHHDSCAICARGAFEVARERDANGREARTQTEKQKFEPRKDIQATPCSCMMMRDSVPHVHMISVPPRKRNSEQRKTRKCQLRNTASATPLTTNQKSNRRSENIHSTMSSALKRSF